MIDQKPLRKKNHKNKTQRIDLIMAKKPMLYFTDGGLGCHVLNITVIIILVFQFKI